MTDLGNWINTFLTGYVAQVVSQLCGYLWPLGVAMLTLYVTNYGLAVMRGEVSEPMEVFAWKVVKIGITMTVALSAGFYMTNINAAVDSLQNGMATVFVSDANGGVFGGVTSSTGAFGALDMVFSKGTLAVNKLWAATSWTSLDVFAASFVFTIGMDIFVFVAGAVTVIAKVFASFALAIGPAAVLCLMFKPTAKFFDSWLSFLMSACVMTWFVFFSLGLSLFIVGEVITDLQAKGAFDPSGGGNLVSPIDGAFAMLVMYVLCAILVAQSPRLASSLTGGPAMSTGAAMAISYVLGRGSGGGRGGGAPNGDGGGGVKGGAGAAYGAGKAAGYSYQRVSGLFGGRR
ncbi:MAG: type IV secretion system protein [Rhodocyclales bacterium]|nr:type IV secretion system protein [Rhodocyclales bacterium]